MASRASRKFGLAGVSLSPSTTICHPRRYPSTSPSAARRRRTIIAIQNYFRAQNGQPERVVTGNWVVNNQAVIRSNAYDDNYPFTYPTATAGVAQFAVI